MNKNHTILKRYVYILSFVGAALFLWTPSIPAVTLKIATLSPDGSYWMKAFRRGAQEVTLKTARQVKFKFYPGGVMGDERAVIKKIRIGQLHGGAVTSGSLSKFFRDNRVYNLPMLFNSMEEVDYVRHRMDPIIIDGLYKGGFVTFGLAGGGFAYLMSQRPMRQVSDLSGAKVWTQEGDVMSATALEIAGVSPVQLSLADVYTALQTGLIDTVGAPAMGAIALQWHTKLKYLTDVPLTYLTGAFVIDAKVFAKLEPEDQRVVREAVRAAAQRLDAGSRDGEKSAMRALKQQGIQFVSAATAAEVERWHDITRQATVVLRKRKIYSDAMFDELERLVEEYRKGAGAERGE
jgi:TRAP-type C4-dicarboxylate transport system substrate-binding protein